VFSSSHTKIVFKESYVECFDINKAGNGIFSLGNGKVCRLRNFKLEKKQITFGFKIGSNHASLFRIDVLANDTVRLIDAVATAI